MILLKSWGGSSIRSEHQSHKLPVLGSNPSLPTISQHYLTIKEILLSYHDYGNYETKWSNLNKDEEQRSKSSRPRVQIISPQKMLIDIQAVLNSLPEKQMSVVELQEAIQKILDGEV